MKPILENNHPNTARELYGASFAQWAANSFSKGKVLFVSLALMGFVFGAAAQQYSIDWYKVAGGGGTSTGGAFSLGGSIGQHDAGGPMLGGNYSLTGGFWGILAVVTTPGAPLLTIKRTPTNTVVVSWPSPSTGFVLQQTSTLAPATWSNVPQIPADDGTTRSVVLNAPSGNCFFRLIH